MVVPIAGVLVAFYALPPGWGMALLAAVIVWEVGEKVFWLRLIGRYPVAVGTEALIGSRVTATTACRPQGRVRLHGETWPARCSAGAGSGEPLIVEGIDEMTLIVRSSEGSPAQPPHPLR